jgi:hypothetical protein
MAMNHLPSLEEELHMRYDLAKRVMAVAALACTIGWAAAGCQTAPSGQTVRAQMLNQLPASTTPPNNPSNPPTTIVNEYEVIAVPPPAIVEVVPPQPHPAAVWVPGYWAPVPHWVWVRGRYR